MDKNRKLDFEPAYPTPVRHVPSWLRPSHALLPFILAMLLGCSGGGRPEGELPELQPARGEVTRSGQPVAGGLLRFRAEAVAAGGSDLIITSAVADDGSFELFTTHALSQRKAKGAPAGEYSVTYLPPGETQDAMPVTLPDKVTIVSGPNELTIKLGDTYDPFQ